MPTFVRVKDNESGHEYDLPERRARQLADRGAVTVLEDYEPNAGSTARARPPKYRVDKAGNPIAAPESTEG